ncbi:c-type cytochrome [Candidatus Nitrospira allomarina]|uniref:Cytochrome c n=1 Tax=Candidatus Nitrospira allomarina TaxID=3020900 RepID=A0AA96GHB1_9BACT|nr:cytochrome c [Candidatus Nitrospira allomarina]WNM58863.1 cytochrome c [Candidatus Nitrospira allomarina]
MNRLVWMGVLVLLNSLIISGLGLSYPLGTVGEQPGGEQGRELYRIHCLECHGAEGRGDGPRAALLAPRPGNLVSAAISAKTDAELLEIIAEGVPRTAMSGWSHQLSADERRNILAFIRTLVHFQELPSAQVPSSGP